VFGAIALCLPGHAFGDQFDTFQRIQESCQQISYSAPVGTIDRSIVRIEVAFDDAYFEDAPKNEVGTAFVIDKHRGILVTALHTLLPGASVRKTDCNEIAPVPGFLTLKTAVFRQSEPIMNVPVSIIKDGWDGCRDTALLQIEADLLANAMSLDIVGEIPAPSEELSLLKVSEAKIPAASYLPVTVNMTPAPRLSNPQLCREWIPDCCERGVCRLASGPLTKGGISGSPILDEKNRFVGMIVRGHDDSADTSWVLAPRSIEPMLLEITNLENTKLDQIVRWTETEAYAELADGNQLSNLEFMKFVETFVSDPNLLGLEPAVAICPFATVAEERGLGARYAQRLKTLALERFAVSQDPSKSKRVHLREIGQEFTRVANQQTNAGNTDAALEAAALAEVAFSQSIALFMQETDASPFVSALALAMPDIAQSDIAIYASMLSANEEPVNWDFQASPRTNRVFSSMLREYADANAIIARNANENVLERAALAATAAYWSATLSDQDANRARSLRTLGDAYVVGLEPGSASVAYATASTLAKNAGESHLSSKTLARMIESAEIAGVTVPQSNAAEIAIDWPETAFSPFSVDTLSPTPYSATEALDRFGVGWTESATGVFR